MATKNNIPYFVIILIFLASFLLEFSYSDRFFSPIHGNWIAGDQYFAVGVAYYSSDEGLLKNDSIMKEITPLYPSSVFSLLSVLYNLSGNMFIVVLISTLILKIIFTISTYFLALHLSKNKTASILAVLFVSFSHFMGSEEIGVSQIIGKTFVFAFTPLIFYLFIKNRERFSLPVFILLGILLYSHSITTIPLAFAFSIFLLLKKEYKTLLKSAIPFALIFLIFYSGYSSIKQPYDFEIIKKYSDITFPNHALLSIGKFIIPIAFGFWYMRKKNKDALMISLLISLYSIFTIAGYFSTDLLMMQFYRGFKHALFLAFIFSAFFIHEFFKKTNKIQVAVLAILIFLPFSSIFYSNIFNFIGKPETSAYTQIENIQALGLWLEKNTDKNSIILIPPEFTSIRIWSKRAIVISYHDMALCMYNTKLADRCREIDKDVNSVYSQQSTKPFADTAKKYNATHIITFDKSLDLKEVFKQNNFRVYEVNS